MVFLKFKLKALFNILLFGPLTLIGFLGIQSCKEELTHDTRPLLYTETKPDLSRKTSPDSYFKTQVDSSGGTIFAAMRTFKPKDNNLPLITLVSASHTGDEEFFETHQHFLDKTDIVLYEMLLDWKPKAIEDRCDDLLRYYGQLVEGKFGVKEQYATMKYFRSNFRRADLTNKEFVAKTIGQSFVTLNNSKVCEREARKLAIKATPFCARHKDPFLCHVHASEKSFQKSLFEQNQARRDVILHAHNNPSDITDPNQFGDYSNYMAHEREATVKNMLSQILKIENAKTIAILYGAAHMTRFEEFIRQEFGYELAKEEWIKAMSYTE